MTPTRASRLCWYALFQEGWERAWALVTRVAARIRVRPRAQNKGPRESPAAPGAATAFVSKSALRRQRKKEKLAQRQAGDDAPSTSNGAAKPRPAHVDKAAPRPPTEKAAAKPPAAAAAAPQPKKQLAPPSAKPTVPGGAPWKSNWTGDDLSEDADAERPENAEGSRIRVAPLELTVSPQFQVLVASAADEALPEKPSDGEQPAGPGAGPGGKPKLRIKKRSRQKNIRKDNRPPELVRGATRSWVESKRTLGLR